MDTAGGGFYIAWGLPCLLYLCVLTERDQHHVEAAEGWLELGNHVAAFEEIENIPPKHRGDPVVLKVRWRIYAQAQKWGTAFHLADGMTRMLELETDVQTYIWRSYAARRMPDGNVQIAFDLLRDVCADFPDEPLVPFNLACYACRLGRVTQGHAFLDLCFTIAQRIGVEAEWKKNALADPDVEPLWVEIEPR